MLVVVVEAIQHLGRRAVGCILAEKRADILPGAVGMLLVEDKLLVGVVGCKVVVDKLVVVVDILVRGQDHIVGRGSSLALH